MKVTKEDVLDAAKGMLAKGLVSGTAGNVSGRIGEDAICLTPSSVPYETMTLDDLVVTDLAGNVLEGTRGPTSEKALHLACFRLYPEVGGVIHCHAAHATMFAVPNTGGSSVCSTDRSRGHFSGCRSGCSQ